MKMIKLSEDHYVLAHDKEMHTIPTSEAKEILGVVDVHKKACAFTKEIGGTHEQGLAFIDGYNQCLEDNKEKKYTEEDMRAVFMHGFLLGVDRGDYSKDMEDRALSNYTQPKTEWEVEFVDGKLKLKS